MIAIGVAIIAAVAWFFFKPKDQAPQYISAEVSRGDIEDSVLATGVLEATKMVSVGAQVSGQVKKMYVQLGDQVKQGQLIAQIDSIRQENELKTAEANIKNQQAQLAVQQANLAKVEAEYKRQQAMFSQDATSRAELEAALANYKTAQAQIASINAQIEQSRLSLATTKGKPGLYPYCCTDGWNHCGDCHGRRPDGKCQPVYTNHCEAGKTGYHDHQGTDFRSRCDES